MFSWENLKLTWQNFKQRFSFDVSALANYIGKLVTLVAGALIIGLTILGLYWDHEPELFDVEAHAKALTARKGVNQVSGSVTISTAIRLSQELLNKRGGYLTNDITPPGIFLDNIPSWEFGVLVQLRDLARTLRNNFSRSQSQSTEDSGLVKAENQFYFDNNTWIFPDTEGEYREAIVALEGYLVRLGDGDAQSAQFYTRADNLRAWLSEVETRLGSLSQRLSASVGKRQLDTSLAGDSAATQSTSSDLEVEIKTPWTELDNVFYEARGTTWALIHLLRAVEVDFEDVLQKKNARVSLQQIIRELEPTQDTVWSPMILNGEGFRLVANHSLVMGSYISRANAAIIDLRRLLEDG